VRLPDLAVGEVLARDALHLGRTGQIDRGRPFERDVSGAIERLVVDGDRLTAVELVGGQLVPRVAVFIRPVNVPHPDGLAAGIGCDLDDAGFPVVDGTGRTTAAGVWAAGNAVDPRFQVITAAGTGSAAAIAINADLVQDDIARALSRR
jgi:thioredoxin reductase